MKSAIVFAMVGAGALGALVLGPALLAGPAETPAAFRVAAAAGEAAAVSATGATGEAGATDVTGTNGATSGNAAGDAAGGPVVAAGLSEAMRLASTSGRPVVALVTANWCGPCQMLKRTTLKDAAVEKLLGERAVTVHLEDSANREDIARLPVEAYPTTLVIRGDEVVGRLVGYADAGKYAAFLGESIGGE